MKRKSNETIIYSLCLISILIGLSLGLYLFAQKAMDYIGKIILYSLTANPFDLNNPWLQLRKLGYGEIFRKYILNTFLIHNEFMNLLLFTTISFVFSLVLIFIINKKNNIFLQFLNHQSRKEKKYIIEIKQLRIDHSLEKNDFEELLHQIKSSLAIISIHAEKNKNDKILDQVDRCDQLICSYLDHSYENEQKKYVYSQYNLKEILEFTQNRLLDLCDDKNISFKNDLIDTIFFCDFQYLSEAFETLYVNAIEYSSNNSIIYSKIYIKENNVICEIKNKKAIHFKPNRKHYGIGIPMAKKIIESHFGVFTMKESTNKEIIYNIKFNILPFENE